jgi:hypothetical protein
MVEQYFHTFKMGVIVNAVYDLNDYIEEGGDGVLS